MPEALMPAADDLAVGHDRNAAFGDGGAKGRWAGFLCKTRKNSSTSTAPPP
jgi:hypothetical protein